MDCSWSLKGFFGAVAYLYDFLAPLCMGTHSGPTCHHNVLTSQTSTLNMTIVCPWCCITVHHRSLNSESSTSLFCLHDHTFQVYPLYIFLGVCGLGWIFALATFHLAHSVSLSTTSTGSTAFHTMNLCALQ